MHFLLKQDYKIYNWHSNKNTDGLVFFSSSVNSSCTSSGTSATFNDAWNGWIWNDAWNGWIEYESLIKRIKK